MKYLVARCGRCKKLSQRWIRAEDWREDLLQEIEDEAEKQANGGTDR